MRIAAVMLAVLVAGCSATIDGDTYFHKAGMPGDKAATDLDRCLVYARGVANQRMNAAPAGGVGVGIGGVLAFDRVMRSCMTERGYREYAMTSGQLAERAKLGSRADRWDYKAKLTELPLDPAATPAD